MEGRRPGRAQNHRGNLWRQCGPQGQAAECLAAGDGQPQELWVPSVHSRSRPWQPEGSSPRRPELTAGTESVLKLCTKVITDPGRHGESPESGCCYEES